MKSFEKDQKSIDAVIRNIEIIGEAARNIPKEIKAQYSDIPWKKMVGMRDKVSHEYFGVDIEIVWKTASEDIPELGRLIKNIK